MLFLSQLFLAHALENGNIYVMVDWKTIIQYHWSSDYHWLWWFHSVLFIVGSIYEKNSRTWDKLQQRFCWWFLVALMGVDNNISKIMEHILHEPAASDPACPTKDFWRQAERMTSSSRFAIEFTDCFIWSRREPSGSPKRTIIDGERQIMVASGACKAWDQKQGKIAVRNCPHSKTRLNVLETWDRCARTNDNLGFAYRPRSV
jgi:hypothetical protein